MAQQISEQTEKTLLSMFPMVKGKHNAGSYLVDQLVETELHRRGSPDKSGAFHALSLNQGSLLREEYDLSTHGHSDGWLIGALLVAEALGQHISKGYIYFAMGFSVLVELLNLRFRQKKAQATGA